MRRRTRAAGRDGACRDRAGNSSSRQFALKYDATPPAVTGATPGRSANAGGLVQRAGPGHVRRGRPDLGRRPVHVAEATTGRTPPRRRWPARAPTGPATERRAGFGLKYDETAPRRPAPRPRSPNDAGWYNRQVAVAFSGSDTTSGIEGCASPGYDGPDSAGRVGVGHLHRQGGQHEQRACLPPEVRRDGSRSDRRAGRAPARPGRLVRRARALRLRGVDEMSGVAECPSVEFSGPDGPDAEVLGRCRDRADNTSQRAFPLRFDGNPPEVTDLKLARRSQARAELAATADIESVRGGANPRHRRRSATIVFGGPGTDFVDERVYNGLRYAYRVTVRDLAGNTGSRTVSGVPTATAVGSVAPQLPAPVTRPGARRLIAPLPGAIVGVGHPPLLRWTPVRKARYYNVQLFRAGRKQLTAWPAHRATSSRGAGPMPASRAA